MVPPLARDVQWQHITVRREPDRLCLSLPPGTLVTGIEFTFEVRGPWRALHFAEGIPPELRGLGLGYKLFRAAVSGLGWVTREGLGPPVVGHIWDRLSAEPDLRAWKRSPTELLLVEGGLPEADSAALVEAYARGQAHPPAGLALERYLRPQ